MSSRSAERLPGREHIPIYSKGFATVRILQLILAIICLGLTAYTVAVLPITGAVLMLFTVRPEVELILKWPTNVPAGYCVAWH